MTQKLILKCKNDVINNKKITKLDASKLFNVDDKYKLIFANILKHVLLSEKDLLLESLDEGAYLILSGILNEQVDDIVEEYKSLKKIDVLSKGDWSAILMKKD